VPAQPLAPSLPPAPPAVATSTTVPAALDTTDVIAAYKALYDTLGRAYWEASDINAKDQIQGTRDAIYDILTDFNIGQLQTNTAAYLALTARIKHANGALEKIKDEINQITKNITTAASVVSAITKVLNIAAMF
jgi:hypothetical protein